MPKGILFILNYYLYYEEITSTLIMIFFLKLREYSKVAFIWMVKLM